MYGQGDVSAVVVATGVAMLPANGAHPLFTVALVVTVLGVITIAASVVVAFKQGSNTAHK